jgi:glutamate-ammonia-ligase adenylyltransferase
LRRTIEREQELLADKYGDPITEDGEAAELVTLALGKLGGREPNYHSDLDAVFLYSAEGETRRRVGGHRATTTNQRFFNQLALAVITRINHLASNGRLYQLDSRLRPMGEEGLLAVSIDAFVKQFTQGIAPLWQRLALCKARAISGSPKQRKRVDDAIVRLIRETPWYPAMVKEIRDLRQRMEQTASPDNLKRGYGGTIDVEFVAQMLILRHGSESPEVIVPGTIQSLYALAKAGHIAEQQSLELIHGYRVLRRIETNLRLMNTPARHELPDDAESMRNLAFLMDEPDSELIVTQCQQAKKSNRRLFDQLFEDHHPTDKGIDV